MSEQTANSNEDSKLFVESVQSCLRELESGTIEFQFPHSAIFDLKMA
jgi:hypothetical protein